MIDAMSKMWWGVVCALCVAGCLNSNSVSCEDGSTCPQGNVCDVAHGGCVLPDQVASCDGMPDNTSCLTDGACHDGVCFTIECGNGFQDPDEACDDGNNADGDMCARDCLSDLTCGNGRIDLTTGESCDDGNYVNHDGCTSACQVETSHWLEYVPKPTRHRAAAAAYDSRRDRVVVFGGGTSLLNALTSKTWEWAKTHWVERIAQSTPPARFETPMAFDHERGRAVLFGGNAGPQLPVFLADTWEWDGEAWRQIEIAGPAARAGHALVYDAARKRIVLFGGTEGGPPFFDDTWEYDGTTWTQIQTAGPPGRYAMLAAYDPKRGRVVISTGRGPSNAIFADTWEYDGATWRNVTPAGLQPQLVEAAMAFDATLQKLVVFGGGKTYTWDGTTWTDLQITVTQPDARSEHSLVSSFPQPLLHGGFESATSAVYDDTYYFTGSTWVAPTTIPAVDYNIALDPLRRRHILYGGGNTYELSEKGYRQLQTGTPPARNAVAFAPDPIRDSVVMFGGAIGSATVGSSETWTLSNNVWSPRTPGTVPPARLGASAVFDGTRVIMFGGRTANTGTFFADTWSWDGTNWTSIPTAASPPGRMSPAMGYDPIRNEVILFGGFTYNGDYIYWNDTWAFDGTNWSPRPTIVSPVGRASTTLAWDAARGHLVLAGGNLPLAPTNDAWEWTGTAWRTIEVAALPSASMTSISPMVDGSGILGFPSFGGQQHGRFELRWDGVGTEEYCDGSNLDEDELSACSDDDCWSICTPLCPPGTSCMTPGPSCGDGSCALGRESCHTCASDCPCTPVCGDFYCDPGETCPGDCPL